jgi:predicted transcriptional regulator
MAAIRLNDTDEAIIDKLREGRNLPSNIAAELDVTRQYVSERMGRLREHGIVRNIGNGVYELTEEGSVSRERDYLKSFGKYADTNIGEAVEQVHEELGEGFEERERDLFGQ